ncbi:hypothetical protein RND71_040564 [Anisodus tanguticus]|uniref:Bulb-type lectin domain-containing protein n=1 Tax=Anisodus tanguticus TaxID=243964 RepID=A0AAE1QVU5_9SOLA|nr:hypothetical protein RND71_040564 [Anisodus tanguticus]
MLGLTLTVDRKLKNLTRSLPSVVTGVGRHNCRHSETELAFDLLHLLFLLSVAFDTHQGSSFTTSDVTTFWPSPSGEFAFGFQRIGNGSGFLLAKLFNKIKEKTIVWSANRNSLAPDGSKVQLSTNGRLVLTDPNG